MAALRRCTSLDLPASLPRLLLAGRDRVDSERYRSEVAIRLERYAAIQITLSGSGMVWETGAPPRPVPPGSAFVFLPGEAGVSYGYPAGARAPWDFVYAELGGGAAELMAADVIAKRGRIITLDLACHCVRDLLRLLSGDGDRVLDLPAVASCELACALLAAIAADPEPPPGRDRLVRDARAWLAAHLGQPVGIAHAATALGVSREHLTRVWTAALGEPPGRWLTRERLARGEQLLREGGLAVAAVTAACGFGDPGHFAAAFRRRYGVPPAVYRRRILGGSSASSTSWSPRSGVSPASATAGRTWRG